MVRFLVQGVPPYQEEPVDSRAEESVRGSADVRSFWYELSPKEEESSFLLANIITRSGVLLLLHDGCRGRRKESLDAQVPGRLSANPQGQLCPLARCSDSELPCRTYPVPDCEYYCDKTLVHCYTDISFFFQPFVSSVGIAWTAYLSLTNSSEEE